MSEQPPETQFPGSQGTVVVAERPEPNLVIRALWFVAIGWWLSGLTTALAILLQLTIIGIPAAIWAINRIPQITTLKSSRQLQVGTGGSGAVIVGFADRPQRRWWVRAIYYILVGWWVVSIWMALAWVASATLILMPLGFWMYGATGAIQTLRR